LAVLESVALTDSCNPSMGIIITPDAVKKPTLSCHDVLLAMCTMCARVVTG
jgi:hypothetical protein